MTLAGAVIRVQFAAAAGEAGRSRRSGFRFAGARG